MEIEIGSKWQDKDGGVYVVTDNCSLRNHKDGTNDDAVYKVVKCIWYRAIDDIKDENPYVRTEEHFIASFKPYEPVYEYQWAYPDEKGNTNISRYYIDNEAYGLKNIGIRLDFTKRERK